MHLERAGLPLRGEISDGNALLEHLPGHTVELFLE
jgi:hypothetical protein